MNDIYEKLFDITNSNMLEAGLNFSYTKNAYMYIEKSNPNDADVFEITSYEDNYDFLQVAYLAFLKRPVDERALENWKKQFNLPKEEFQKAVITTLISSQEFINGGVKSINNIYQENETYETQPVVTAETPYKVPEKLVRLYKKQPLFIKNIIKKSIGMK